MSRSIHSKVPTANVPAPHSAEYRVTALKLRLPRRTTGDRQDTSICSCAGCSGVTRSYPLATRPGSTSPFPRPEPSKSQLALLTTTMSACTGYDPCRLPMSEFSGSSTGGRRQLTVASVGSAAVIGPTATER